MIQLNKMELAKAKSAHNFFSQMAGFKNMPPTYDYNEMIIYFINETEKGMERYKLDKKQIGKNASQLELELYYKELCHEFIKRSNKWLETTKYKAVRVEILKFIEYLKTQIKTPQKISQLENKSSFRIKPQYEEAVRSIMLELHNQLENGLLEENSSIDNLMSVLNAKDFTTLNVKIYFSCNTNQVPYIFTKISRLFFNCYIKTLSDCESFYSKKGNLFKYRNLKSSNSKNPLEKDIIDNIINKYMV